MTRERTQDEHARIDYLEVLRFMLAVLTMAWHYYYFAPRLGVINAAPVGFPGLRYCSFSVEVFFIISGFIIIASAVGRTPTQFVTNRLVRLGPCLLVCASITFAANLVAGRSPSTLSLLSSILVLPLPFYNGIDWSYWSLGIEVTFYAIVFVAMRFVDIGRHIATLALLLSLYSAATLAPGFPLRSSPGTAYPFEQYAPFFSVGMLLYLVILKKHRSIFVLASLLVTFVLVCIRSWMEAARISEALTGFSPAPVSGFLIALAALGIFIGFTRKEPHQRIRQFYSILGRTSYPLYLIHQNLGYLMITFAARRLHLGFDVRPIVMVCMVLSTMAIAVYLEPVLAARYRTGLGRLTSVTRTGWLRTPTSKATVRDAE